MVTSNLFYFAAKCLSLDEHPEFRETICSHFAGGEVNPDDFIFFCDNQLVLPAIYLSLNKYYLLDVFPAGYIFWSEVKIIIYNVLGKNLKKEWAK